MLHHAVASNAPAEVIDFLIMAGTNVNFVDKNGKSALDLAIELSRPVEIVELLQHGMKDDKLLLTALKRQGTSFDEIKMLVDAGAKVEFVDG